MNTYVILRRDGWQTAEDLRTAADRSLAVGDEMPEGVRERQAGGGCGEPPPNAGHEGGFAPVTLRTLSSLIPSRAFG